MTLSITPLLISLLFCQVEKSPLTLLLIKLLTRDSVHSTAPIMLLEILVLLIYLSCVLPNVSVAVIAPILEQSLMLCSRSLQVFQMSVGRVSW